MMEWVTVSGRGDDGGDADAEGGGGERLNDGDPAQSGVASWCPLHRKGCRF